MFSIVRLLIAIVVFALGFLIIRKTSEQRRKFKTVILAFASIIICIGLSFVLFENTFVSFKSPQEAFEYMHLGKYNFPLIVEGDKSDFVVGEKNAKFTIMIVPKTESGWKIRNSLSNRVGTYSSEDVSIVVYNYEGTNDYYISAFFIKGGTTVVKDSQNSEFFTTQQYNGYTNKTYVTYYTHITDFSQDYWIDIENIHITRSLL